MAVRFLCVFMFFQTAGAARAQGVSVADLIRQLGSAEFQERENASQALKKVGEKALPALAQAARDPDIEISRRSLLLCRSIQERLIIARIMKPRQVRVTLKDLSLSKAMFQVYLSTGVSHTYESGGPDNPLTLDTGFVPLWQALEHVWRGSGYSLAERLPTPIPIEGQVREEAHLAYGAFELTARKVAPMPQDSSGPCLIRALPRPGDWHQNVAFVLEIWPDPNLGMQGVDGVRFTRALDGNGIPGLALEPSMGRDRGRLDIFRVLALQGIKNPAKSPCFVIPIKAAPGNRAKMCREIQGVIAARFLVRNPVFTIDNLTKSVGKKWVEPGGASLKILEVDAQDEGDLYVRLHLEDFETLVQSQPGPRVVRPRPGFVAMRGPADLAADSIEVSNSQGRLLPRLQVSSLPLPNKTLTGVELLLTFQAPVNPDEPLRLVFNAFHPLAVVVPFTLRNVALP